MAFSRYFCVDVLSFLGINPSVTVRVGVKIPRLGSVEGQTDRYLAVASVHGFDFYEKKGTAYIKIKMNIS